MTYRPPLATRGLVLVADGAGGDPDTFDAAVRAVRETGTPLVVRSFNWTHGWRRTVADMTDVEHGRTQGQRLAAEVACYRAACPNTPITLLAYSAGTHVALEAARWLEPDSVERIVLLAPAVATDYDLRPALMAARQGVDVFTSERDGLVLGLGTGVVGTADGKRGVDTAGRVGFAAPPADACLIQRLRQHPWDASVEWTGNRGSHGGSLNSRYFRAYVLPLLAAPTAAK
jgi:pimeloyl-ACP methyl ester carboxylesterase